MSNTTGFRRQPRATVWLPPRPSSPSRSNGLLAVGRWDEAAERFGVIIDHQQRLAARIAYHYLRRSLRGLRGRPGRLPQGLPAPAFFSRRAFPRAVAYAHPGQRLSRSPEGEETTGALACPRRPRELGDRRTAKQRAVAERLPAQQRTLIVLAHLEGRPTREVSVVMGLNESTVRVHLFRALRKLRGLLDRDGRAKQERSHLTPQSAIWSKV